MKVTKSFYYTLCTSNALPRINSHVNQKYVFIFNIQSADPFQVQGFENVCKFNLYGVLRLDMTATGNTIVIAGESIVNH